MTTEQAGLTRIERDKLAFDPEIDFRAFAARPPDGVAEGEWTMLKWSGIYQQQPPGHFLLRVRVPGGLLTADQFERLAGLAETYAGSQLCLTTRQDVQFHDVRQPDLGTVLDGVAAMGLTTRNACGDVVRNVVTCPLQGVCPHETRDVRHTIGALADDPELRDRQRNLPRKFKIGVAGCGRACGQTLIHCFGWYPVSRTRAGAPEHGWRCQAGGGLGARPHLAQPLFDWVPDDLVLPVTRAAVDVFRRLGNRQSRALARLKIVVAQLGAAGFAARVLEELAQRGAPGLDRITAAVGAAAVGPCFPRGQPVIPQRQPGTNTVRILVPRGELSAAQARQCAAWARQYGDGTVMLTARQNLQLRGVPDARVDAARASVHGAGFATEGHEHLPDMVVCAGTTHCGLAAANAPAAYRTLLAELATDRAFWTAIGPLRIHITGCPNSCAQHWIADIGLCGRRLRTPAGTEEGFTLCVGGDTEGAGHLAQPVADIPSRDASSTVRRLLDQYLASRRSPDETFGAFARRVGPASLAEHLGLPPRTAAAGSPPA